MKTWINNYKLPIISTFIGAFLGLLYWNFIGCSTGSCAITSVWYRTMLYGAFMGWLIGDLFKGRVNLKTKNKNKN